MQKPKPQDFGLSEAEFSKLQALDQKLEKHLPFVVVTVAVLALVVAFWDKLNWAILFVPLALWPFALIVSQILHATITRLFLGRYSRYRAAARRYDAWFVRTQMDFWNKLSGRGFEIEVAALMNHAGYHARLTPPSGDEGIDVMLGDGTIVQCKAHSKPVSPAVVRELYGTLRHHRAPRAILISRSGFTKGVWVFKSGKPIQLWDLHKLIALQKSLDN